MTAITGHEPRHWHDSHGRHRMRDMRTVPGYPERFWDKDEREYVDHLKKHEEYRKIPMRDADDTPAVQALFDVIKTAEKTIKTARELINSLREKGC